MTPSSTFSLPTPKPTGSDVPIVAISMGDPLGIGPEIIAKSLADPALRSRAIYLIFGLDVPLRRAADLASIPPFWLTADSLPAASSVTPGAAFLVQDPRLAADWPGYSHASTQASSTPVAPTALSGRASVAFLDHAITACLNPPSTHLVPRVLVTAPISKTAWHLAGFADYPGHTELLADRFRAPRHAMLFVGRALRVILVTIHIPLGSVPAAITPDAVFDSIQLGHLACISLGIHRPRIAVCGLNPHAGELGLLGSEDQRCIRPAIDRARALSIDAAGPFPADAVFPHAADGRFDLVVAMYHDQGLIPIKLLERELTVNVTVGLPHPRPTSPNHWFIRTSPAHGTAFDIAGSNRASPASMTAAIELALATSSAP